MVSCNTKKYWASPKTSKSKTKCLILLSLTTDAVDADIILLWFSTLYKRCEKADEGCLPSKTGWRGISAPHECRWAIWTLFWHCQGHPRAAQGEDTQTCAPSLLPVSVIRQIIRKSWSVISHSYRWWKFVKWLKQSSRTATHDVQRKDNIHNGSQVFEIAT